MATKGASYRYGNTRGANGKGTVSDNISYQWARDFNKSTLLGHFDRHGKQMGYESANSYASHAVKFANNVDRKNNISFIDKYDSTYKYSLKTNELAIITKNGYVITYFKPKEGYKYYQKQIKEKKK